MGLDGEEVFPECRAIGGVGMIVWIFQTRVAMFIVRLFQTFYLKVDFTQSQRSEYFGSNRWPLKSCALLVMFTSFKVTSEKAVRA